MAETSDTRKESKLKGLFLWLILLIFIFSVPFIPLVLDKELNVGFLEQQGNDNALVFFGFTGCKNVCPLTMAKLRQLLDSQQNSALWPQVLFVDIDENSTTEQAAKFAQQFHPAFAGLHIESEQLKKMSAMFGLNIKQQKDQIVHMGKTYLLQRKAQQWRLVKVYNANSFSVKTLQKELFNVATPVLVANKRITIL